MKNDITVKVVKKSKIGDAYAIYNKYNDTIIWNCDWIMGDEFTLDEARYIIDKFGGEIEE